MPSSSAPFECLRVSAGVRERQPELQTLRCSSTRRDHTIYPIGDWSVRTLWGWWSTGLGLATTSHITNVRFVPPYQHTTPAVLQAGQKKPPLQAAVTPTSPHLGNYYPPKLSPSLQLSHLHVTHYLRLPFDKDTQKILFKLRGHAKTTIGHFKLSTSNLLTSLNFPPRTPTGRKQNNSHATLGHAKIKTHSKLQAARPSRSSSVLNFPPQQRRLKTNAQPYRHSAG